MSEENKAVVRRAVEVFNRHDLDAIPEMFTADFVVHFRESDLAPQPYRQRLERRFAAFPDVHATIEDVFAEGDRVAIRYTFRGTHQGEFEGVAPTGKLESWTTIAIWRVAGDKLAEGWFAS